jgi:hypothetical protein
MASRTSAQLISWKEEQKRKEKEAKGIVPVYRSAGLRSGNAKERVAAELKRQKDEQLRKKNKAQLLLVGSSGDQLGDSHPLSDSRSRTQAELVALEEERKRRGLPNEDADGNDQSYLENLKSRTTTEELAMLQENGSMKNLAEEFGRGIENDGLEKIKARTAEELYPC